jgi:hypothetical protein
LWVDQEPVTGVVISFIFAAVYQHRTASFAREDSALVLYRGRDVIGRSADVASSSPMLHISLGKTSRFLNTLNIHLPLHG